MAYKDNPTLPVPVDFIDLTQDSPINLSRRENKYAPSLNCSSRRSLLRNRTGFVQDFGCGGGKFLAGSESTGSRRTFTYFRNTAEDLSIKPSASVAIMENVINLDDSLQSDISVPGVASEKSIEKALPSICPICLEDLSSALKPMSTRCGHIYCSDCLQATLKAKKKCPKCQSSITEKTCIRLYF